MSCTPHGLAVSIIGKKKKKLIMSLTPSGLVMIAIEQKKQKMKNVTNAIWCGRGCHLQEKIQNKKCHARHMVWSWPALTKKREK